MGEHFPITRAAWKRLRVAWLDVRLAQAELAHARAIRRLVCYDPALAPELLSHHIQRSNQIIAALGGHLDAEARD